MVFQDLSRAFKVSSPRSLLCQLLIELIFHLPRCLSDRFKSRIQRTGINRFVVLLPASTLRVNGSIEISYLFLNSSNANSRGSRHLGGHRLQRVQNVLGSISLYRIDVAWRHRVGESFGKGFLKEIAVLLL